MTSGATSAWAVIIGIDHYPSDRCFGGAVRDAEAVRDFLQDRNPQSQIRTFTASCPSSKSITSPPGSEESWPTWNNIIASLKAVIQQGNLGDVVYIHYSGHGTRLPAAATTQPDGEHELALVLFENNEFGCRYLEGRHLASALHKMVDKGLIVTLVLDCCFSGSVARDSDVSQLAVRHIPFDPDIATYSAQMYDETQLFGAWRDSRQVKDWLVDPDGYTILTACGPLEIASEVQVGSVGRRGALSYYLLVALHEFGASGNDLSHGDLHQHLATTFHALWPQQTPMRYGNFHRSFFGHLVTGTEVGLIPIFHHQDGTLRLQAGEAHGICEGDEFVAYPNDQRSTNLTASSRSLKVTGVRPFESDLAAVHPYSMTSQIRTGSVAKLSLSLNARRIRVRLATNIREQKEWIAQATRVPLITLVTKENQEHCLFTVTINDNQEYAINTLCENPVKLATVPFGSESEINAVLEVISHLGAFKFLEGIRNRLPSHDFQEKCCIKTRAEPSASGAFEVQHGDLWHFVVENSHEKPLYLSVFEFRDTWEVVNVLASAGGDGYLVVDPKQYGKNGRKQLSLTMEVPKDVLASDRTHCTDILKIFITSKPTRFPSMVLPALQHDQDRHRASGDTDRMQTFLGQDTRQFRGPDEKDVGEWFTRNFIIRTILGIEEKFDKTPSSRR